MMARLFAWCRERPWTWAVGSGLVSGAAGAMVGRYFAPTKIVTRTETKTETVEVVKWQTKIVRVQGATRIVEKRVEVPGPAGPTVTVERVVYRDPVTTTTGTDASANTATNTETKTEKVTEYRHDNVMVGATLGMRLTDGAMSPPSYGLMFGARIWGPVWAMGNGWVGTGPQTLSLNAGLGVSF